MINIMLRYLGIKTKLLEPIKIAIDNVTPQKGSVIDLFGGSNTVAQSLINDYTVYTNDYQAYSYIAAKALIEYHSTNVINSLTLEKVFGKYYKENKAELTKRFSTPLAAEKKFLDDIGDLYYGRHLISLLTILTNSAYARVIPKILILFLIAVFHIIPQQKSKNTERIQSFSHTVCLLCIWKSIFQHSPMC